MILDASKSDAELLGDLARRVERLGISRVDPERFHADKSEVVSDLRRLGERMRRSDPIIHTTTWRPPYAV